MNPMKLWKTLQLEKGDRQEWETLKKQSEELVDYIQTRVTSELQLRPDIKDVQPETAVLTSPPLKMSWWQYYQRSFRRL